MLSSFTLSGGLKNPLLAPALVVTRRNCFVSLSGTAPNLPLKYPNNDCNHNPRRNGIRKFSGSANFIRQIGKNSVVQNPSASASLLSKPLNNSAEQSSSLTGQYLILHSGWWQSNCSSAHELIQPPFAPSSQLNQVKRHLHRFFGYAPLAVRRMPNHTVQPSYGQVSVMNISHDQLQQHGRQGVVSWLRSALTMLPPRPAQGVLGDV